MDLPAHLLPVWLVWSANGAAIWILLLALRTRPWRVLSTPERQHLFYGTCLTVSLLWNLKAGITPGLGFHFLGMSAVTLMLGAPLALLAGLVASATSGWQEGTGWLGGLGINFLLAAALPVAITHHLLRFAQRKLPLHFFVFTLFNAFLAAMLSVLATALIGGLLLWASSSYSAERLGYEFFPFLPLLLFPEAILNGMSIALLVGFKPQWVRSFDDDRYLKGR